MPGSACACSGGKGSSCASRRRARPTFDDEERVTMEVDLIAAAALALLVLFV
jgi:hypothetical protein